MSDCIHNQRCRWTHGFQCEDCNTFFPLESPTYRRSEYLGTCWMALHNVNSRRHRAKVDPHADVAELCDRIGVGQDHFDDYEELIGEAEAMLAKYGSSPEAAQVTLK